MSTYNQFKHDVGLLRTDGSTKVGFNVLRDRNGRPAWEEFDDETLAQQFFTGAPDAAYRPPQKEFRYIRDDWRGGYGLKYQTDSDPKRYYSSINCDARFRGKMIAGPLATAITKPSTPSDPTITDGGLELWDDSTTLTNWTETGSATLTKQNSTPNEGTFYAGFAGAATGTIYQDIDSTNDYAGATLTFTAYCKTGNADAYRLAISDGVGTTEGSTHSGGGSWEQLSVARTFDVASDKVRLICDKRTGSDYTGFFDGPMTIAVTSITNGIPSAHTEFNDKLYQSFGKVLGKLNGTGTTFDYVATLATNITDMQVYTISGTDWLFIALGDGTNLVRMTTGEVFTISPSNERAYFFTATPSTLYGIKQAGGNEVRKTTTVDTWSDVTSGGVGHAADNQTDLLIAGDNTIIVPKEDMPYYIDSSDADQPLMDSFRALKTSTSGDNSIQAFGRLYIQGGDQTLKEFKGTPGAATATETNISPANFMDGLSDFSGKVQALAADDRYLIAVLDNSTEVELLFGNWENVGGVTDWRWHPIIELTLTGCETAYVSSVYKKRLWVGSTASGDSLYYYPLTTKYGDIENDSDYKYQQSGEFIDSWLHGNLKGDDKAHYDLTATLGHSYDADIYFEIWYKKWEDTGWTDIGDLKGTSSDRTHTLYIPDDASSNHPVSKFFQVKFIPKTDDTAKSPILEGYDIRGAWRPVKRKIIECTVETPTLLGDGSIPKDEIADVKAALEEANDATWPVTFYDIDEATITVNFLKMTPRLISIEGVSDQKKKLHRVWDLILQKITLS